MDDLVEVGVFAGPTPNNTPGEPLYLKQHRVRGGKQTIRVTVPRRPARAGIDPYRRLIERERDDNVAAVADDTAGAGRNGRPHRDLVDVERPPRRRAVGRR